MKNVVKVKAWSYEDAVARLKNYMAKHNCVCHIDSQFTRTNEKDTNGYYTFLFDISVRHL